jgi:MFS family permease
VLTTIRRAEYFELVVLFFIQGMAMGMWFVPLGAVLDAHDMAALKPYAFATTALAAFVSPLVFGAMADRHSSPVKVLRGLAVATAFAMALAATAIKLECNRWVVLALIQVHSLCTAPNFGISTAIIFSRLKNSQREFGPIRAMATFGWMAGCWIVSALDADTTALAGYSGSIAWLLVATFTFFLPAVPLPQPSGPPTLQQRMGWDALSLLKNRDHRVVFITAALFNVPIAAMYPFTPSPARTRPHSSFRVVIVGTSNRNHRHVHAGGDVRSLAHQMDFCHWPRTWIDSLQSRGFGQQIRSAPRHVLARVRLHVRHDHFPNLSGRTHRSRVARAGAIALRPDDFWGRQPGWLFGQRLVVSGLHAIRFDTLVRFLGRPLRSCGSGRNLFPHCVSWDWNPAARSP